MASKKYVTKTERAAAKMPLLIWIPAALFVVLMVIVLIYKEVTVEKTDIVAKVNDYEISAEEFSEAISREKANAFATFKKKYGVDISGKDLSVKQKGVLPADFIKNYALNKLKYYKVEQALAVKYKIVKKEDTDYKSFVSALEKENNDRAQKIANGEVVYGAKSYTNSSYFNYTYSNMRLKIKEKIALEGNPLFVSEKALNQWYNLVKDVRYKKADIKSFDGYILYFEGNEQSKGYSYEGALEIMNNVKSALESGKNKAYIKRICKDIVAKPLDIDDESASALQKQAPNLYEAAVQMKKGEVCNPACDNFTLSVLKCNSSKFGGYKAFSEYKDSIHSEYVDEKYDEYVEKLVKSAKVEKTKNFEKLNDF